MKPDFTMQPLGTVGAARVCSDGSNIDCFGATYPNKARAARRSRSPQAAIRNVSGRRDRGADGTEDTDSSAVDFVAGTPAPRNNPKPAVDAGSVDPVQQQHRRDVDRSGAFVPVRARPRCGLVPAGVTTNPSSSTGGTTSGRAARRSPPPSDGDDGGCNATGDTTAVRVRADARPPAVRAAFAVPLSLEARRGPFCNRSSSEAQLPLGADAVVKGLSALLRASMPECIELDARPAALLKTL